MSLLRCRDLASSKSITHFQRAFSLSSTSQELSLIQAVESMKNGEITSVDLTRNCLKNIKRLNPSINAFISSTSEEETLELAKKSDEKRKNGLKVGLLEGIPISVKDNFNAMGTKTTCASQMLEGYTSTYDSTVVEKLKNEGAIIIGKTNMDEFAMGSTSTLSRFGKVVNPWSQSIELNEARVAGGSSGGSAASVAARMSFGSIGSDTGGSVRQPAAFCGNVGLKPSYGRVSRWGLVSYASSLDTPGIFAKTVADSGVILEAISGFDSKDSTSSPIKSQTTSQITRTGSLKGLRVGIPKEYFVKELSPEIVAFWTKGAEKLQSLGCEVVDISLPNTIHALPAYYIIAPAESSSNLAKYDGVRYGHRSDKKETLTSMYLQSRTEAFGEEVKRRILLGNFVLSRKAYESYYIKAQQMRRMVLEDFQDNFTKGVDFILTPTTPSPSFLASSSASPVEMYINDVMTIPASLAGKGV